MRAVGLVQAVKAIYLNTTDPTAQSAALGALGAATTDALINVRAPALIRVTVFQFCDLRESRTLGLSAD